VVQIDSTPLDVLVLLDDGVVGRVELTGMIDVATRAVPAAQTEPRRSSPWARLDGRSAPSPNTSATASQPSVTT
jgi:hypothetical protein